MPPLLYDASREGGLRWLTRWKHTVWPGALSNPVLYLLLGVHTITLSYEHQLLSDDPTTVQPMYHTISLPFLHQIKEVTKTMQVR